MKVKYYLSLFKECCQIVYIIFKFIFHFNSFNCLTVNGNISILNKLAIKKTKVLSLNTYQKEGGISH